MILNRQSNQNKNKQVNTNHLKYKFTLVVCFIVVWQECYDELTGYSYYWNTKTDEVTWTTPSDFKSIKEQKKDKLSSKKKNLYVPPRAAPILPSTSAKVSEASFKIYSISESSEKKLPFTKNNAVNIAEKKNLVKKPYKRGSDSEDELVVLHRNTYTYKFISMLLILSLYLICFRKIELISSYGGDTESESEESDLPMQNVSFSKFRYLFFIEKEDNDMLLKFHDDTKPRSYEIFVTYDSKVFNLTLNFSLLVMIFC